MSRLTPENSNSDAMAASLVASAASNDKSPDKTEAPIPVTILSKTELRISISIFATAATLTMEPPTRLLAP